MDKFFDLQNAPYYTPTFLTNNTVSVYGYTVPIPDEPEDKLCINFGLKKEDQDINYFTSDNKPISKRVYIPDDLAYWEHEVMESFIDAEYFRRKNGVWILLNGKKYYITGVFYFYLNYWTLQTGGRPFFTMSDWRFFTIWYYVVMNPQIFGLLDFKCRRIGDTEKALCILYEYGSRVKNTDNLMQDCRSGEEIFKTYLRLTFAHENMEWFMKPINRGTSNPKAALEFKFPEEAQTMKKLKSQKNIKTAILDEQEFEFKALGSTISYYTSEPDKGDGKRLGRAYIDEFGKPKGMSPKEAWRYIKQSCIDQLTELICGKSLFTSTVEDIKGGMSLEIVEEMWDEANADDLNDNGETTSGLIRIVRGALERGKPDRYGEVDAVAIEKRIQAGKKDLIGKKKFKDLTSYTRQNCITIEDIFTSIAEDSNFNTENLAQRRHRLRYELINPRRWVRGNFEWMDGKRDTKVIWVPCENGRWVCAGKPQDWGLEDNAMSQFSIIRRPGNTHAFCAGLDPYAQKDVLEKNPSKGGIVVKRRFDAGFDGDKFDDEGEPLNAGEHFMTNRYVCAYLYRHPDPNEFYEDTIKTMVFWGTDFLPEKNHSSALQVYLEQRRYDKYIMTLGAKNLKNYRGQSEQFGISANDKTIEHYFSLLTTISHKWHNTIDIPEILDQLLSMNYENRGKKDLGVAAGLCEIAAEQNVKKPKKRDEGHAKPVFEDMYV